MGFLALIFTQSKSTTLWFPLFFWCGLDISCYLHQGLWCLESNIKFSHYSSYISSFVFYTWFLWTCYSLKFFHLYVGFVNACKKIAMESREFKFTWSAICNTCCCHLVRVIENILDSSWNACNSIVVNNLWSSSAHHQMSTWYKLEEITESWLKKIVKDRPSSTKIILHHNVIHFQCRLDFCKLHA